MRMPPPTIGRLLGSARRPLAVLRPVLLTVAVVFAIVVAGLYFQLANRVGWRPCGALWACLEEMPTFFWIQLGLLAVPAALAVRWPRLGGRALQVYLVGSTVALLAMSNHFRIPLALTGCAVWAWCAMNTVRLAVRRWVHEEFASWELAAATLLALLTIGCTLLALIDALTRVSVISLAVLLLAPGAVDLWRRRSEWLRAWRQPIEMGTLECVLCEAIWLSLAMTFVWACAEEVWSDSTRVHLPFARQIMIEGGLPERVAGDWFRLTPNAVQTLFAGAGAASTFRLAKWLSWSAVLGLAMLVGSEARRACRSRTVYLFAAAITLGAPILLWEATSLYVDHFAALFITAAFVVLFRAGQLDLSRGFWFSAMLMGIAAQVKYQAMVAGVVWCAAAAILMLRHRPISRAGKRLAVVLALFSLGACPWYLRIWWLTGDPVYPFLNSVFHSPFWPAGASTDFNMESFRLHGVWQWLAFPWIATFHTSRLVEGYDGWLGLWCLALMPFLLFSGQRGQSSRGLWFAGAAVVAGISLKAPYLRYWLPAYPLMLIPLVQCAAGAFHRPVPRWATALLALPMLAAALAPIVFWLAAWGLYNGPWLVYTRQKSRTEWLVDRLPGSQAVAQINIDPHDGVLCLNYAGISAVNARAFEYRETSLEVDGESGTGEMPAYLADNRIRYWLVNHARPGVAYYTRMGCGDYWTDNNIVAASQGVAIYDAAPIAGAMHYASPQHRDIPPALAEPRVDADGWLGTPAMLTALPLGRHETLPIDTSLEQSVWHTFTPQPGAALVRCTVPLRGDESHTGAGSVRLTVEWFDALGTKLANETSESFVTTPLPEEKARLHSAPKHGPFVAGPSEELPCVFSRVPPGATLGAVSVTTYNARVWIQTACLTFWQPPAPPNLTAMSQPQSPRRLK